MNSWEHKYRDKVIEKQLGKQRISANTEQEKKTVNKKEKERKKLSKTGIARKMRKYF